METTRNSPRSTNPRMLYAVIAITIAAVAFGVVRSRENATRPAIQQPRTDVPAPRATPGPLSSAEPGYTFGFISMAAGNVSHRYKIRNSGATPVTVTKVFTSCMCTTATLVTPRGAKGPFGMPGHAPESSIAERIGPGEESVVEVVFDPRAHGPSGLGLNERSVTIQNDAGSALELRFTAMVRP